MFIAGDQIGGPEEANYCYLAVFKSQTSQTETWYLGNVFMRDYYVVLDMTPKDARGENFIQIGLAKQRTTVSYGSEHYSSTSTTKDNLREAYVNQDTSLHISYRAPDDPDKPDDSETDGGNDDDIIPDKDDSEMDDFEKFVQDNKVLVIVGGSAAIFLVISLLTCCCCCGGQKSRKDTYIYRTYSQLRGGSHDNVQVLDDDDTPGTRLN